MYFLFLTELYKFICFSKYTKLSIAMNSIFMIFILFNLHSVISESAVTLGNSRRYICLLACYAYNFGSYHLLPRTDIWCQCLIHVFGLSQQEIADLPPVTGEPPLLDTDMKSSMLKVLVSDVFVLVLKNSLYAGKKKENVY